MSKVRIHLEKAIALLDIDQELDRLVSPRHTDKDALVFLPTRVAKDVVSARREIEAALDELAKDLP
jgi:hypothetical protein